MIRPCECTNRLIQHYHSLSTALETLDSPKSTRKVKETYEKATPQKGQARPIGTSPDTSQLSSNPAHLAGLRSINERIKSEIERIDLELKHLGGASEPDSPSTADATDVVIHTQTQRLLAEIQFPSSPNFSPSIPTINEEINSLYRQYTPEQSILVTTTMLSGEEKALVRKWATEVGAIYVSDYSPAVTHLIARTTTPHSRLAVRSMKTMQAILDGRWLLPLEWITAGIETSSVLCEEPFELEGDQYSEDESPRRARMSHRNEESKLLDGYKIYLFGTFGKPNKANLTELLLAAGAEIIPSIEELARSRQHDEHVLVVGDPNEQYDLEKDQGVIEKFNFVQTEWIYGSISAFEPLDIRHFSFL